MPTQREIANTLCEDLDAFSLKLSDFLGQLVELRLHLDRDLKKMAADKTVPKDMRKVFVGVLNGTLHPSALDDLVKRAAARWSGLESKIARRCHGKATRRG